MEELLKQLRTDVWRTSGARYNAARRLHRREIFATASLAFFSAASVFLAFAQKVLGAGNPALDIYLTLLSACLGVFLLVISLIEWGARASSKSDRLHRNAEELNALQRRIGQRIQFVSSGGQLGWDEAESLRADYETIKQRCEENHAPIDDAAFRARHRRSAEFGGALHMHVVGAFFAKFLYLGSSIWYFAILWLIALGALLWAPW